MREYEPLIKTNHPIIQRFAAIKEIFNIFGLSDVLKSADVSFRYNEEEGIFMYLLNLNNLHFESSENFRMELNEIAYVESEDLQNNITKIDKYRFQSLHIDGNKKKNKDYIAFDFEPDKVKYPKIHINADKNTWGDHLTFPETTNLNINKMSCPLAMKVFDTYSKEKDDFPTNQETNSHYVKIFEEVNEYGL